jgi:DNA (cytosine-5)-methyltransferase 1
VRELSLFTGAGGGLLGTHHLLGWETVGYVEIEDYCQRVIKQRIADGLLPEAPIFSDIRAFISEGYAASYTGLVDVITGGFPCQPFSVAGKQAGENDPRNLWPETMECIRIIQPRYALLENVPGLLGSPGDPGEWDLDEAPADNLRYFGTILRDLSEARYGVRYITLGADDVGAPHRRKRLWIMATDTNGAGQ